MTVQLQGTEVFVQEVLRGFREVEICAVAQNNQMTFVISCGSSILD
jgi:hypothetical protein